VLEVEDMLVVEVDVVLAIVARDGFLGVGGRC
jgi:hypothetical protein